VDGLWATKSESVGPIIRAISFQDFQVATYHDCGPAPDPLTSQTDDMQLHSLCTLQYNASRDERYVNK